MKKINSALANDEKRFIDDGQNYKFYNIDNLEKVYTKLHEHDFMEIFILMSGDISYVIEQGRFEIKEFDILLVPPHTLHELVIKDKTVPYKRLVLWIYPQYIKKLSTELTDLLEEINNFNKKGQYLIRNPEFTFTLKPYFEKILQLQEEKSYGHDILIENTFRELFILINHFLKTQNNTSFKASGNPMVLKTISYIENNLTNPLSLNDIAKQVGFDSFYLSHIFSKEVGTTIHKYIIKKRLNLAKRKLDEGYNIKEITKMVGFHDESHFIQTFKKEYNMTPNKYKNLTNKR